MARDGSEPPGIVRWSIADTTSGPLSPAGLTGGGERALAESAAATGGLARWAEGLAWARGTDSARERVRRRSQAALARRASLFAGVAVRLDDPPRWRRDPRSGHEWPHAFHSEIDVLQLGRPADVKYAWEISRLRHCVALAQADAVLDDGRARAALRADLDDWLADNPMGWSVNWTSAMEVALRAVNLICVDSLLLASGARGAGASAASWAGARGPLVGSVYQHAWFVARNLETAPPRNNHLISNAVGLVWAGRYFGRVGEAAGWLRLGRGLLAEAADEQVLRDGLGHEGSLPYHVLALELFLLACVADPWCRRRLLPTVGQMTDALCAVMGPGGWVPHLGDDDGGRALAFCDRPSRDARRVLALAGTVLEYPPACRLAGPPGATDVPWLLGAEGLCRAAAAAEHPTAERRGRPAWFSEAGVAVLGGGLDHVVVDLGPVGLGGTGGHGHLDAMSVEAVLGGADAVRDPGTATYTGDHELRERMRGAEAHSTVIVDGLAYARLGGTARPWTIDGDSPPRLLELSGDARRQRLLATQDLPAAEGTARHRRAISWRPGSLEIEDVVEAPAGARIAHRLHLPGNAAPAAGAVRAGPITIRAAPPDTAAVRLEPHPASFAYGSLSAGAVLVVEYRAPPRGGRSAVRWELRHEPP